MRFQWQNLTKEDRADKRGLPWHGRAWFDFAEDNEMAPCFRVEWLLGETRLGARIAFKPHDDDTIGAHIGVPLASLFFSMTAKHKRLVYRAVKWLAGGPTDINEKYGSREIAISFHDGTLYWDLWTDPDGWTNKRPRWRDGHVNFVDLLFGKTDYVSHVVARDVIVVPMPEGKYTGDCTLTEDVWTRPRGVARRVRRAHIDMKEPIPFPGKGENSWDCGDDALHGLTTEARTFGDAIGAVVRDVMNSRFRHGGRDWRPGP